MAPIVELRDADLSSVLARLGSVRFCIWCSVVSCGNKAESLIECNREGLRDGRGLDTSIPMEPSPPTVSQPSPVHSILRIPCAKSNYLHSYLTVSQVSELDQGSRDGPRRGRRGLQARTGVTWDSPGNRIHDGDQIVHSAVMPCDHCQRREYHRCPLIRQPRGRGLSVLCRNLRRFLLPAVALADLSSVGPGPGLIR